MRLRAVAVLVIAAFLKAAWQPHGTAAAMYAEARLAFNQGDNHRAIALARAGQSQFGSDPKWRELFMTVAVEARVLSDSPAGALKELEATPRSGDPEAEVRRLMARGYARVYANHGEGDDDYAKADALAARVMPSARAEIALRRTGPAFWKPNAAELIERYANEALALVDRAEQPYVFANAYGMLATAAMQRHEYQEAIEHFERGMRLARALQAYVTLDRMAGNAGWSYMQLGDTEQAKARFEYSVTIARRLGDINAVLTHLANIAAVLVAQQRPNDALPIAQESVRIAEKAGNDSLALALSNLAHVEIEAGSFDAARRDNDRAAALWRKGVSEDEYLYTLLNAARIDAATGWSDRALNTLACLDETKNDLPLQWNAQAEMAAIFGNQRRVAEAERMYRAALDTGDRARVEEASNDAYLFAFESLLIRFYDDYIDFLLRAGRLKDALLVAERSRARTLLRDHSLPSVTFTALARAHDATILEYWLAPRRSLLWVITGDRISLAVLPPGPTIDREVDAYRTEITARGSGLDSARGARLYQTLIAPTLPYTRSGRFIVIPDGHLGTINLESLITGGDNPHYWIEDAVVSYAPALALIPPIAERKSFRDARALVIGDIPAQGPEFPALSQAKAEIDDVASHFGLKRTHVVTGEKATRAAYLTADLRQFSYIHFAAHGTASVHSPLESSVVLADGRLSAEQIIQAPLNAELITVSSCSSAAGRTYAGEGPVGLGWAFLRAGAQRVVASQWDVSDSATSKIMDHMYGSLEEGRDHADALRDAKLQLVHAGGKYSRPFYWAPFILYGAP